MEIQNIQELHIKKFNGRIPLHGELFDVLKNEDLIFLHYQNNEAHIMTKTRYAAILQDIKKKSWHTERWFQRSREGTDQLRRLYACACSIAVNKTYMSLEGGERLKKKLLGQELIVKIFS